MDRKNLEMQVAELLREIEKFDDQDKRKYIVDFIMREIEKDATPFYLDRHDLTNIESDAMSNWSQMRLDKPMGGIALSSSQIRTLRFLKAVVGCLRKYNVLHRIVDAKFDPDYDS